MEQNIDTETSMTPVAEKGQKNGNGLKIATAISCIVAVCGIGFGIYGMMQSAQKDSQISDSKVQIKEDDGTITTIETPEIETTTNNGTTVTITDTAKVSGGPYIENGYFYVPRWGVKYKLSDDLTNYGYAVDQNNQGDSFGEYVIGLTAISKDDYIEQPMAPYYNDIFSCSVVTIRAKEDSKKKWWGDSESAAGRTNTDVQFNGFDFIIHDIWRTDNCNNESYMASTEGVVKQLEEILSNPEKI